MTQELAGTLHAGTLAALQLRPDAFTDYLQQEGGFRLVRGTTWSNGCHHCVCQHVSKPHCLRALGRTPNALGAGSSA